MNSVEQEYVGHRILAQNGFKSKNLSGGFKTFIAPYKEQNSV